MLNIFLPLLAVATKPTAAVAFRTLGHESANIAWRDLPPWVTK